MGEQKVTVVSGEDRQTQHFMQTILNDLSALEALINSGRIERTPCRIGAEQEMLLVDDTMRPALVGPEILQMVNDDRLTTEIGRFNLEANLSPQLFGGNCLRMMEQELNEVVNLAQNAADSFQAHILLTGILPTLRQRDLTLHAMTPKPRYYALNQALQQLRGNNYAVHIKGLDELHVSHDNMMLEACCTSFQVHIQVSAEDFARKYNIAQAITAPVLAAAANSPVLFGHRLWHETRIPLFQHSVDERSNARFHRRHPPRVSFGDSWIENSVVEIFRDEIARFRIILTKILNEDSLEVLSRGEIPLLEALRLHNGTVWRWNRPCYGIMDGQPHLRIENRVIPSGPTIVDEVANASLFLGLMAALPEEYGDVRYLLPFDAVKENFIASARHGLKAQLTWFNNTLLPVPQLLKEQLLPLARAGLRSVGIDSSDIDRYIGVIEERVERNQNGALWALHSLNAMQHDGTPEQRHRALTAAMLSRQGEGNPVHTWEMAQLTEQPSQDSITETVEHIMSTDLLTVRPDDVIDLVVNMMAWRNLRHVPVENDTGHLQGVITYTEVLRHLAQHHPPETPVITASHLMQSNIVTISPDTTIQEALKQMHTHAVSCLPVVEHGVLVGLVTTADMLTALGKILLGNRHYSD